MRLTPPELARAALEAAPDAMIIIDAEGVIRFVNRQVFAVFGYAREEIIGHLVEALLPERFRARHLAHRSAYSASMRVRPMGQNLELFGLRRDGTEFPVEISLSPVADEEETLVVAAIRDVSDRQRIQKELIAARAVAEEARALADLARESADRANQGKSRFLATASHDLRQPLQALALLNGTLRRTVKDSRLVEALAQQEQAIGAMSRLLNALLDISKLESGAIQPDVTDFSVARIFEEMRREFGSVASRKGLTLEVAPTNAYVRSDPSLVEQVVRNLLSNAIKYTPSGMVVLRCPFTRESQVRIDVQDTGIGIPAEKLPLIYDEFYQVGVGTNASRDGYGLGLSIVKRIVQLLDLKLEVTSLVGSGSTFSLLLPSAGAQTGPSAPQGEEAPGNGASAGANGQPRVLLVEDDPGVRDATRMLLRVEGYQVTTAASLEQAIAAAQSGTGFELLMTDYHLGANQTGIQVIAALRERLGPLLKSVLVTGDTSTAVRGLEPDPHLRILSKPIRAEALLRLLREFLAAD
ncbi:MAG: hybrid sensor histidine kinase/response regulator [Steroidobacteraceae bacterium]